MNIWLLLSALVYLRRCLSTSTREQGSSKTHIFYAVEIDGDSNTASFLAKQHGMQFISKVKWVNIRQLIIETCMLLSQSRMTEQVMDFVSTIYTVFSVAFLTSLEASSQSFSSSLSEVAQPDHIEAEPPVLTPNPPVCPPGCWGQELTAGPERGAG
ncbi:uncharacterized protein LOC135296419 isoform X4 [Passer domesticus]|uniref:uncharacterized protein LOC135296419 isoform X4 n=1 Tax=Passer domesticus TaxID=48849 RepID=UPI0030FEC8A6